MATRWGYHTTKKRTQKRHPKSRRSDHASLPSPKKSLSRAYRCPSSELELEGNCSKARRNDFNWEATMVGEYRAYRLNMAAKGPCDILPWEKRDFSHYHCRKKRKRHKNSLLLYPTMLQFSFILRDVHSHWSYWNDEDKRWGLAHSVLTLCCIISCIIIRTIGALTVEILALKIVHRQRRQRRTPDVR